MKRAFRMRRLAQMALLLGVACPFASAVELQCGQPQQGSVQANGTATPFTITLRSGDSILLRFIPISPGLSFGQPIELSAPDGAVVQESFNVTNGMHAYSNLKADGTYVLTVKASTAGMYQFVYVPLNRPCTNSASLTCGKPFKGSLAAGQMQTSQLNGKTGDLISLRLAPTAGSDPAATFYVLAFDSTSALQFSGKDPVALISFGGGVVPAYRLTSDGTQTFVVAETSGQSKLNFSINAVGLNGACAGANAGCGTSTDGSLAEPLATAIYSINGNRGDIYRIRTLAIDPGTGLQPVTQVFDVVGNVVDPATGADSTRLVTLPANGQYTLVVQDGLGVNTGTFALSLARLNNPCREVTQALPCGTPVNGQVNGPLRTVSYSVDAEAGDVYMLRLFRSTAGFTPRVEVYAPQTGSQVQSVTAADLGTVTFTAPATGTYTLLAFDALDGKQSGNYSIWLGRLNRPCSGSTGLTCLSLAPGSITQPLQTGLYSYATAPGDAFTVRLADTGGNLQTALQVYDPRGFAVPSIAGAAKAVDVTGSPGGSYTILVTDQNRTAAQGTFGVEAMSTKGSCGSPLAPGVSTGGLISGPAPFNSYVFSAAEGDSLLVRAAAFTPGFAANVDLYDPNGRRVGSSTSALAPPALTASGVYTAIVAGAVPRSAGNFVLSWQLVNNPSANVLQCGQTTSGALGENQFWYYSLSAGEGDQLKVLLTRQPGTLNAQLELFDSRGTRLAVNSNEIVRKVGAGNYLVLVSPATANAETGGFALALQRPNNPCAPNALACGQTILKTVTAPGQLDAFPFTGSAGDPISVTVTPRAGNISPVTELYDASGNAVGPAGSTGLTSTLSTSGQYTITVHDRTGNTGSYRIGLQRSNNACPENDSEKPSITLRRPTGGEVIAGGSVYQVVWQSDDNAAVTQHTVRLSTDGGTTFQAIPGGNALSGVAQSFSWLVPGDIAPSRNAVIQVTATDRSGNTQAASSDVLTLIGSGFAANASATYEYDALNHLTKAAYQDGRVILYSYDGAGNLIAIAVQ